MTNPDIQTRHMEILDWFIDKTEEAEILAEEQSMTDSLNLVLAEIRERAEKEFASLEQERAMTHASHKDRGALAAAGSELHSNNQFEGCVRVIREELRGLKTVRSGARDLKPKLWRIEEELASARNSLTT